MRTDEAWSDRTVTQIEEAIARAEQICTRAHMLIVQKQERGQDTTEIEAHLGRFDEHVFGLRQLHRKAIQRGGPWTGYRGGEH